MNNDTLNALILRHGDNLLRRSGWPDSVGMTPVAPETVPGWLFASGVLDADEILALTTRLCQALNDGRAKLLTASAQRLAGTPARLHLYPAQSYPRPEALTDFTCISLPYAQEWLTKAECGDLLAFLKDFIDRICDIVRQDAKRIAAALVPSAAPRLMEKRFGDWRLVADEYEHDNWLDSEDGERLDQVLDGILVRGARFCPVLLTLVNVTHVLVARVAGRSREFSIQLALGASRTNLYVQVLADLLLLMLPAGLVALAVAVAGFAVMRHYLGTMLARLDELSVGWWTVALTIGSTVALSVLIAAVALASGGRPAANGALNAGRQATATRVSRRLRAVLMASQVGVAGLLIAVSVGLFRDAERVLNENGVDLERSSSAFLYQSTPAVPVEASLEQQFAQVRQRLADLPTVEKVSQSHSPLQEFIRTVVVSGRTASQYPVYLKRIDHAYLGITGQSLALGRNFSAAEIQQGASVALVNTAFAQGLERDGGVLGTALSRGDGDTYTVVGVVDDLAYPGTAADSPRIYLPASEAGSNFIIKFHPGQRMSREQLVAFIATVNPGLGVFLYDDLDRQRSDILLPRRITATATLVVALVVMLVSAMGLYGMVSYTTRLARAEIGTRRAFGAQPRHIVLMLMNDNLAAVACGCIASAAVALLVLPRVHPWFGAHEFAVRWVDAAAALGALGLLAAIACYLSARPLLQQSPASALREAER